MFPTNADRRILRDLAKCVAEIADDPVMGSRRRMWIACNSLRSTRPMMLVFPEGSWEELLPDSIRSVSEVFIVLPQGEAHTPIILGQEGDEALLGVVTLEILGLVFNPFNRTLHPMRMLLC